MSNPASLAGFFMVALLVYTIIISGAVWFTFSTLPYTPDLSFALNIVQWGIVSLLSFLTFRQEKHFRSIFFQFWMFFAILGLATPSICAFSLWFPDDGWILSYVLHGLIIPHIIQAWIVFNILFTYIFSDEKRIVINGITAIVVLPLCLWLFWPYYWTPQAVVVQNTAGEIEYFLRPIEISVIWINSFSILVLLAFFLHKLRTDKPIGAYADTLLFLFGLLLAIDTTEYLSAVNEELSLSISQWAFSLIAASMIITLLLRLKFKSQTIADYYESQCISDNPDIDRRVGSFDRLIIRCFFNPEKVSKEVFLGTGRKKMKVRRTPTRISKSLGTR